MEEDEPAKEREPGAPPDIGVSDVSAGPVAPADQEDLFLSIYEQLRGIAAAVMSRQDRKVTLQPTALVHEAWLRLMGGAERTFEDRAHFFRTAAKAMRTILVDTARARATAKRGAHETLVVLSAGEAAAGEKLFEALAVHEALERLERLDPRRSRVVELRFFCGLEMEEIAAMLGTTVRTTYRDWDSARAWLYQELSG
jgi:RNA polymerase sigma factor (TIGR02999 family)